jgi:spore maturation protein CgeB
MRVLFLESNAIWINSLAMGFRDAGHDVMISGPLSAQNLPEMIASFQPELAVTIGWGKEHTAHKRTWIRQHVHAGKIPVIYWAVEDPAFTAKWSLPFIRAIEPAFVFTISSRMVSTYERLGIPAAHLDFGYQETIHAPVTPERRYQHAIAVVANAYPDVLEENPDHFRRRSLAVLMKPLLAAGMRIDLYGHGWDQMEGLLQARIPSEWIHGHLPYTEANRVYSSASILLGLQNDPDQVTQRTYEILGSGGFLLTLDTPGVRASFQPDVDLVVADSPQETVEKVQHYLSHPEERLQIRRQGRRSVAHASYRSRAESMVKTLIERGVLGPSAAPADQPGSLLFYVDRTADHYETYTVARGDTLWSISRKAGVPVEEIQRLNGLTSDVIDINQRLLIRPKIAPSPPERER